MIESLMTNPKEEPSDVQPCLAACFSCVVQCTLSFSAKSVPKELNPLASLTVTYAIGAIVSLVFFFLLNPNVNIAAEYRKLNWAPIVLGLAVVGLEVGYIYAYKVGWPISTAQIVQSAVLAVLLLCG